MADTLWGKSERTQTSMPSELNLSGDTKDKIKNAFKTKPSEESLKPYRTPVDTDSLAKTVC